jgi:uncharacterized protein
MERYDCIIIGSGPAGLGAAFTLTEHAPDMNILIIDKEKLSTGGLRNDCKMNFTYPVGFPVDLWTAESAENYLPKVQKHLSPDVMLRNNFSLYKERAARLDVRLLEVDQSHLGTDGGLLLIKDLTRELGRRKVSISLEEKMLSIDPAAKNITTHKRKLEYENIIIAPGRQGFQFLQDVMNSIGVAYVDHIVDIGIRVETRNEYYPIVNDYYDPKFIFPDRVRTFCTNSGKAHVVKERYVSPRGEKFFSVNGHAYAEQGKNNGLVNFALLKTIMLTEPLASGQRYAENLGHQAMLMGGGQPIMQRIGDFRMGNRSKKDSFNDDLYDFKPTLQSCTPGDISLAAPAKILRAIWKSMKLLDTIIPGVMHPSTIMYYPEIKLYANKPVFTDAHFQVRDNIYLIGDGAGTSRGITVAWASGIRAAEGILSE